MKNVRNVSEIIPPFPQVQKKTKSQKTRRKLKIISEIKKYREPLFHRPLIVCRAMALFLFVQPLYPARHFLDCDPDPHKKGSHHHACLLYTSKCFFELNHRGITFGNTNIVYKKGNKFYTVIAKHRRNLFL